MYSSEQSQSLLNEQGPLAELEHFQGLYRISLLPPIQAGQWKLQANSDGHLTFNVIGKIMYDIMISVAFVLVWE